MVAPPVARMAMVVLVVEPAVVALATLSEAMGVGSLDVMVRLASVRIEQYPRRRG